MSKRTIDPNTPRARALAAAIRELREEAGLSGRELSQRLGVSHGTISHWETGHRVPTPEDVASVLGVLGVTGERRRLLLDLARNAADPNWLTAGMPGIPQQLTGVMECERTARKITEWAPMYVPGLLQTPDYVRAVMSAGDRSQQEIDQRVMVRVGRREIITRRRDPVGFHALIGEYAIRDVIGDEAVMTDQFDFLLELASRSNVTIQIIPLSCGWHPGLHGPFVLYDFAESSPVLHFEHYSSGAFVPDVYDVQTYRAALDTMGSKAMSQEDSLAFLARITKERST
ncbi:helix-turn-helix domain-containing protein [Amycolatopsis aidingensis]|uniref:helix-turn-helix domain-containing protein n=1 Tax=Amycolatopsis aidingensis TaxID=2842453 RepID=UPI001C0C2ED2|nr:helix-turn-helix transcriptional regulator [Amycolatopsis aidingensis]